MKLITLKKNPEITVWLKHVVEIAVLQSETFQILR